MERGMGGWREREGEGWWREVLKYGWIEGEREEIEGARER